MPLGRINDILSKLVTRQNEPIVPLDRMALFIMKDSIIPVNCSVVFVVFNYTTVFCIMCYNFLSRSVFILITLWWSSGVDSV